MANELSDALRASGAQIAKYIKDAAEMKVQTYYTRTDEVDSKPVLGAQTIIRLDGDCQTLVPAHKEENGLALDSSIFDVHEANVKAAIEYRTKMLHAFIDLLQSARK